MSAGAEGITASITDMAAVAKESSSHSIHVAASAKQQLDAMEEISAASEELSKMAQQLLSLISRFKL
ncbi:Methyl-accepting chemotaxis protein McpA [compost metagenome]